MNTSILRIAGVAAFGLLMSAALPGAASAHQWRSNQRIEQRCDRDGDLCAVFRCDWDGDDCVQIGPWRRQYARYDRYGYGYNDYYNGYSGYDRRDGYYDNERREEWRERRRDRDDDEDCDDWRDRDGD